MEITGTVMLVVLLAVLTETSYLTVMKLRQKSLKVARGSLLLDTSAIMDGRIVDVAKSGIISAELIIPRSVVNELQLLADKADHEKRARARKGLENVRELKDMDAVSVAIVNDGQVGAGGVDERLLELAKRYDAGICTTDYNLNKVAKVVDITVVNVNELAQMLRVTHLPGERIEVTPTATGQNRDQAVGYLPDGTMVVVEDARNQIGQAMRVEIVRSLQTEAGRMMFAKKVASKSSSTNKGASNKNTNSGAVRSQATGRSSRSSSTASTKKPSNKPRRVYHAVPRRKKSNEDTLVELANSDNHQ